MRGLQPLEVKDSPLLESLQDLPRSDEASLEQHLSLGGTLAVVGPSNIGKTRQVLKITNRIRQKQCGTALVPVDLTETAAVLTDVIDNSKYAAALYLSLRSLPLSDPSRIGSEILRQLTGMSPALSPATLQGLLMEVLERYADRSRHRPFFILDDVQRIYSAESNPASRIVLSELVQMLHFLAGRAKVNLVLTMSDDVTEELSKMSGMGSRLRIFSADFVKLDVLRDKLTETQGMTREEAQAVVDAVGGHIGDVETIMYNRRGSALSWQEAIDELIASVAGKMRLYIDSDTEPGMTYGLLKQLCEAGRVDLDEARRALLPLRKDPRPAMARLVAANLARRQQPGIHLPYRPAQHKAWPFVEASTAGVIAAQDAPL